MLDCDTVGVFLKKVQYLTTKTRPLRIPSLNRTPSFNPNRSICNGQIRSRKSLSITLFAINLYLVKETLAIRFFPTHPLRHGS